MNVFVLVFSFLISLSSWAEVGHILKIKGAADAYIQRGSDQLKVQADMGLEENDKIVTLNSHLVLHLYPQTQLSLAKDSEIILTKSVLIDETRSSSVIDLVKGVIRLQVSKDPGETIDQKVEAQGVAFSVRGTDFEVSLMGDEVDLDVYEGEVEATSPDVHTFVPEIVKKNEGFRFHRKQKSFARRKFKSRIKDSGFIPRSELRENWQNKRLKLKELRENRRSRRSENNLKRPHSPRAGNANNKIRHKKRTRDR